jgi:hypothetical protein
MPAKLRTSSSDVLGTMFLQAELARLGISIEKLAVRCGMALGTMRNQFSMRFPSVRTRHRIENALSKAIWSSPAEIAFRHEVTERFNLDPAISTLAEVKILCRRLGIAAAPPQRREQYVSGLGAWLAAHPNYQPNQSTKNE